MKIAASIAKALVGISLILILAACGEAEAAAAESALSAQPDDTPSADDVLRFRGTAGSSFYTDELFRPEALNGELKILWKTEVKDGHSGVSIRGDRLYTMGNGGGNDFIYCLDTANGKVVWEYKYAARNREYPGPRVTPTIDGSVVYTMSADGQLHALNRATGAVIWKKNLADEYGAKSPSWGFAGSALIDGDTVYFNANRSGMAFKKANGELVWKSEPGKSGYATPVLFTHGAKKLLVMFGEEALYGVEAATGKIVWQTEWKTSYEVNAADPLVFDDKIFVTSGYSRGGTLFAVGDDGLTRLWDTENLSSHFPSPVLYEGTIIGYTGNSGTTGGLVGINPENGAVSVFNRMRFSNFIVVNETFVLISEYGELIAAAVTPTSFTEVAKAKFPGGLYWAAAAASAGRLYVRTGNGELYCVDAR